MRCRKHHRPEAAALETAQHSLGGGWPPDRTEVDSHSPTIRLDREPSPILIVASDECLDRVLRLSCCGAIFPRPYRMRQRPVRSGVVCVHSLRQ